MTTNRGMSIDDVLGLLREHDALRERDLIQTRVVERREPRYASDDVLQKIDKRLAERLRESGIETLYRHQAETIESAMAGENVVLEAPTASGKTLAFGLPVLDSLIRSRNGHALLIYPMKAVAIDQREKLLPLHNQLLDQAKRPIESWQYDGDVEPAHRKVIREFPPHLLVSNIDFIHRSFLAHAELWPNFLENLKWVVIDEIHEYRGYFGTLAAMVLRRLGHFLASRGVNPQYVLATATCANPKEHAENLTGRSCKLVSASDQFRPRRSYAFVALDPGIADFTYWQALQTRSVNTAIALGNAGMTAIIFCPTRQFAEQAARNAQSRIRDMREKDSTRLKEDEVTVFKGGLNPDTRREILDGLNSGNTKLVFSTNALELGIDITGLDAVVMAGFPANMMSARQQIGRAGRGWERDGLVVYFARNNPFDQFYARNLDAFLDKRLDEVVVDTDNEVLAKDHATCVLYETGEVDERANILGDGIHMNAVRMQTDGLIPTRAGRYKPHFSIDLRGSSGDTYELMLSDMPLGTLSAYDKFKDGYLRAIILQGGTAYRVTGYNVGRSPGGGAERTIGLEVEESAHYTRPYISRNLYVDQIFDGAKTGDDLEIMLVDVNVHEVLQNVTEYDGGDNIVDRWDVPQSDNSFNTTGHACWISVGSDNRDPAALRGLENIVRVGARFLIPADEHDTYTISRPTEHSIYIIESYSGGIGIVKKIFERWVDVLQEGVAVADNCPCTLGCPYCILPPRRTEDIDKNCGMELARKLIALGDQSPSHRFESAMWQPVESNP